MFAHGCTPRGYPAEQSASQAVAELRLAVSSELSTLGMKTDADRKRIHAAEEVVAKMQVPSQPSILTHMR